MIVNAHDVGAIQPSATANFSYAPQYNIEKQTGAPIDIVVRMESVLSRNVRYLTNDDAVESELDEPECTSVMTNGKPIE